MITSSPPSLSDQIKSLTHKQAPVLSPEEALEKPSYSKTNELADIAEEIAGVKVYEQKKSTFDTGFKLVPNNPQHESQVLAAIRYLSRPRTKKHPVHRFLAETDPTANTQTIPSIPQVKDVLAPSLAKIQKTASPVKYVAPPTPNVTPVQPPTLIRRSEKKKKPKQTIKQNTGTEIKCGNCMESDSPLWRSGPNGIKLCNKW
jgi:hypothetical protein